MNRKSVMFVALLAALSFGSLAQLERVADKAFANKPFNPGDAGVVMRATLVDIDPTNKDPVYLTRVNVSDLGTATSQDIAQVKVYLEVAGKVLPLVEGSSFPLSRILLGLPPEERLIPDDTQATLYVWIKASDTPVQGHTVKPRVVLGWAEGKKGGTIEITDSAPDGFVVEDSFTGQVLGEPAGGILNPGDSFPVLEVEFRDTPDVNLTGLRLVSVKLDGPAQLTWTLDNGTVKLPLRPGMSYSPKDPLFVALDEAKGILTLHATVPADFSSPAPLSVAPSLTITLREGIYERTFSFSDPSADQVIAAGLENLRITAPQAGSVLTSVPDRLAYSVLDLADRDRNATLVEIGSLSLAPRGTVSQIATVEITDSGGRLVGYSEGIGQPIRLLTPAGGPFRIQDEGSQRLNIILTFSGHIPLGGSLLLEHRLAVTEENPKNYLARPDALTKFHGVQTLLPQAAIFFGRPQLGLTTAGAGATLTTDGETIGLVQGSVAASPWELVDLDIQAAPPYYLAESTPGEGALSFTLRAGAGTARAGDLLRIVPRLKPIRMPAKEVAVDLGLDIGTVRDWADIELPFSLGTTGASFQFSVPLISFTSDEEAPNTAVIGADEPLSYLKAYIHYDRETAALAELSASPNYAARILEEEEPQPGRLFIEVSLIQGEEPAAGPLARLAFVPAGEASEPLATELTLEILEARDAQGQPTPFALDPEKAVITIQPQE